MTGLLAGQSFDSELIGDSSLMKRPMERVATPLRQMGARIETAVGQAAGADPRRRALSGIRYELPVASAQVKSAVLLAGLYAQGPTTVIEPAVTRDHTERMLLSFGCRVDAAHGEVRLTPPQRLEACSLEVPGDFSSSAFFMVAGSIGAATRLTIAGVGINPTRTGLLDILGADGRGPARREPSLGRRRAGRRHRSAAGAAEGHSRARASGAAGDRRIPGAVRRRGLRARARRS